MHLYNYYILTLPMHINLFISYYNGKKYMQHKAEDLFTSHEMHIKYANGNLNM